MKNLQRSFRYGIALLLFPLMAGCGSTPAAKVITRAYNLGQELPADMINTNQAAMVGFDEAWVDTYRMAARNSLYDQGVEKGTPEYYMRAVRVNLAITGKRVLWVDEGSLVYMGGAYVPDHLPRLHAGDVVEVRHTGTYDTMTNFTKTGEGNIVIRILCRKGEPTYDKCLDDAPRINKAKGVGQTHTAFPKSVREYGFSFTPMYDEKGHAFRSFPEQTASTAK